MNKRLLIVSAVLLALLVALSLSSSRDGFQGAPDVKVVIAKADWCGHCRKAAPEFEKLKSASPIPLAGGRHAVVEILDAEKDKADMEQYKVKGFPSILIVKGSAAPVEYPGERTASGIMEFLRGF